MKVGSLVRVDYGDERGFGSPCIFLGYSGPSDEWMKLVDSNGRGFESHVDYVYPVKLKKEWMELVDPDGRKHDRNN